MTHQERLEAAAAGRATDRAPISLWRHWPVDDQDPALLAKRMVDWQREHDFDFVKYMPSGTFGLEDYGARTEWRPVSTGTRTVVRFGVARPADWPALPRLDVQAGDHGRQNASLQLAAAALAGEVPVLQTVFSPLTTARKLAGDAALAHMRTHPDEFEAGLAVIAANTTAYCLAALASGADGLFFATQCASYRLMSGAEYERFGERWDRAVLEAVRGRARYLLVHLHGDDEIMFERIARYPADWLSWHDRRTAPSIAEGGRVFPGIRVCGLNEHGTLLRGDAAAIRAEVEDAMRAAGGSRQILAPGCVLPIDTPGANVRAAVAAARAWRD